MQYAYGVGYHSNEDLNVALNPGDSVDFEWYAMDSRSEEYIPVTFSVGDEGAQFITLHTKNGQVKKDEPFPAEFTIMIPEDASPGEYRARINVQGHAPAVPNAIDIQQGAFQRFLITVLDGSTGQTEDGQGSTQTTTDRPELRPIGRISVDPGVQASFKAMLTDAAIHAAVFSLDGAPASSSIDKYTGLFRWTPSEFDSGKTYAFDVIVMRGGMQDSETVMISVNEVRKDPEPPVAEKLPIPAAFVDNSKDPWHYVERYESEENYRKWFDRNYGEYGSIYHAVGLREHGDRGAGYKDHNEPTADHSKIPEWARNTAVYWGQGKINDAEFMNFLQFLIDRRLVIVPDSEAVDRLEDELVDLKASIAMDVKNAYQEGYSDVQGGRHRDAAVDPNHSRVNSNSDQKDHENPATANTGNLDRVAVLETGLGEIVIEFFPGDAPNHVVNFQNLTESGFYDGTLFHRIIPGFMIQGGDPNTVSGPEATWGTGGPGAMVDAEFNDIMHNRGIVSMARSASPDSAGSQFFIVHEASNFLDGQYTVFGRIATEGSFETLDRIAAVETGGPQGSTPVDPEQVRLASAKLVDRSAVPDMLDLSEPERTDMAVLNP